MIKAQNTTQLAGSDWNANNTVALFDFCTPREHSGLLREAFPFNYSAAENKHKEISITTEQIDQMFTTAVFLPASLVPLCSHTVVHITHTGRKEKHVAVSFE